MTALQAPTDYGVALALLLAVAAELLAPGACWNLYAPERRRLAVSTLPLPGFLLLVAEGIFFWTQAPQSTALVVGMMATPVVGCLVGIAFRVRSLPRILTAPRRDLLALAAWASLVVTAAAIGVNPLPVRLESYNDTVIPGRMVASPPDSIIPFNTAAYMSAGHNGQDMSQVYFGQDWSFVSRGPLVPFAVLSLFRQFDQHPSDPPDVRIQYWPVTLDGSFLARALGWMLNGMVALAAARLLKVLKATDVQYGLALAWATVAPSLFENTLFLWPKMLSGYFVLISLSFVLESAFAIGGGMLALAWLSHPVGILFIPGVWLLGIWKQPLRNGLKPHLAFAASLVCVAAPWIILKLHLREHDPFVSYLLADGHVPHRAHGLFSWLIFRFSNLWTTLVPVDFYLSSGYQSFYGLPLSSAARWNVQYTRSLPGSLGFGLFWTTYWAMFSKNVSPLIAAIRNYVVFLTFGAMVLSWGFSPDGLGRNTIEPLIPLLIVLSAIIASAQSRTWIAGLVIVWAEGVWVQISSFATAENFDWDKVSAISWALWVVGAATPALAAIFVMMKSRDFSPTSLSSAVKGI